MENLKFKAVKKYISLSWFNQFVYFCSLDGLITLTTKIRSFFLPKRSTTKNYKQKWTLDEYGNLNVNLENKEFIAAFNKAIELLRTRQNKDY